MAIVRTIEWNGGTIEWIEISPHIISGYIEIRYNAPKERDREIRRKIKKMSEDCD